MTTKIKPNKISESNAGSKRSSVHLLKTVAPIVVKKSTSNIKSDSNIEELNSDLVVGSSPNISDIFSNLAHTSTPISENKVNLFSNLFYENLRKRLAFNNQKDTDKKVAVKNKKDNINQKIKEFSDNSLSTKVNSQGGDIQLNRNFKNIVEEKLKFDLKSVVGFAIVIIVSFLIYKMQNFAGSYTNAEIVKDVSLYAQNKLNDISAWIRHMEIRNLSPVWCGLAVSLFSFFMVYMDSQQPGIYPPSPFSPRSKQTHYNQRASAIQLNYCMAIASGFIVALFIHMELF